MPLKFSRQIGLAVAIVTLIGSAAFTVQAQAPAENSATTPPTASAPAAPAAATPAAGDPTQSPQIEKAGTNPPDIARGKIVFERAANCLNCHGWPGDGVTGKNPRSPGLAANLRASQLDTDTMIQIVSCGIPGSQMPYHDSEAYKDKRCYDTLLSDYEVGKQPIIGHTVRNQDIINVVAYVQQKIKGRGKVTKAECEEFFKPGASACKNFQ
jgi:mono/diheme cytochrome c family protein